MSAYRDNRTGVWRYRKWIKDANGHRVRITGTPSTNTKTAAEAAERMKIDQVLYPERVHASATDAPTNKRNKTIREHADTFKSYLPGSKPSEKRTKAHILESHLLPFFGDMTIEQLKQTDIDQFSGLELKRGMAIKSVNNRLAVLSTLIKYVMGEKSKLKFKIKGVSPKPRAVPMPDVEQLLIACKDDRYRAVILLATEAGLRAGEIRGLQWTDIKDGQITVRRALDAATCDVIAPKGNKERTIPLSPRLVAQLELMPRLGIWIVSRLDGDALGYFGMIEAVRALYDLAKVTKPPKLIHCLRHTFGTEMAKRVPLPVLKELMGHEDIDTTMRYVDVSEDQKRDGIAAVFGTIGQPVGNTSRFRS